MLSDDDQEDPPRQEIAGVNRMPLVYLVDSSGVFLPMQDEVFPDEDDFGRIFRNNAVLSARGVPQFAAIMGNCVAGGAYLPVLCDTVLMTEGSGLYLAGPSLVKAAIGQEISSEDLGGAQVHAAISGTVDYREPDDEVCLARLRRLFAMLPPDPEPPERSATRSSRRAARPTISSRSSAPIPPRSTTCATSWRVCSTAARFDEYRAEYGRTLVCGFAQLGGMALGVVANQRLRFRPEGQGPFQFGGVIYADSADKAARFVLDCNQSRVPILFIQDVNGFDVGRDAERTGIIRRGAKLVNAVSNSHVAQDHADHRPFVRRGALRALRQGVRSSLSFRLAGRSLRRDGSRASRAHDARCQRRHAEAARGRRSTRLALHAHGRRASPTLRPRNRHPLRRRAAAGSTRSSTPHGHAMF